MSRDTTKSKGQQPTDVHVSADPVIRDYVAQLRKRTEAYAMELADAREAVDAALGQSPLTDALYKMRRDEDVV
jgi:hypothetical protein